MSKRLFRFGPYEADPLTGELRKHGTRLKLPGQPFQVLLMLLESPGELVSREAIRRRLWPEGTFVDFDHSLNSAVNKLRGVLNDAATDPRYIETVPGRGYRFLTTVEVVGEQITSKPPEMTLLTSPEELPQMPTRHVRTLFLLAQLMYLCFYIGVLANLPEIQRVLALSLPQAVMVFALLVTTAVVGIAVRLFLISAASFRVPGFEAKFHKIFPALLVLDPIWALSPFLLMHHIGAELSLAACAALLLVPFGERTLVLMFESRQTVR